MATQERTWTPAQLTAIETRDRTMLLSAAAGSGKTTVLTERIIRSLTEDSLELSRVLAVTFTRASAADLKVKIGKALAKAIENNPDLARQLRYLPSANISTIDSFCIGILRRFAPSVGISPSFRVADEQEAKLLRASIMEEVISDGYAGRIPNVSEEAFCTLISHISMLREERNLGEMMLTLLDRLDSFDSGVETLFSYVSRLEEQSRLPLEDTPLWQLVKEEVSALCLHYAALLDGDIDDLYHDAFTDSKLLSNIETTRDLFRTLASADHTLLTSFKYPTLSTTSGHKKTELEEFVKERIKEAKGKLNALKTAYFLDPAFWASSMTTLAESITTLAHLCCDFQRRYEKECQRRGAYDFASINRFTYHLLVQNGTPTEAALTLRGELDAVYVDEYQDVNPIQHAIFEAIAPETGRFLVGDIKQSIYRFRQADPTIFAALRATFPPLDPASQATTASHFMSQNFRSDRCVVDFVNVVFDFLFESAGQSIHYCYEDRLDCAKDQTKVVHSPVPVVAFFDSKKGLRKAQEETIPDDTAEDEIPDEEEETLHREAMWVAGQIHKLLLEGKRNDGVTPIQAGDIAILFHSVKTRYKPYVEALSLYGIPCKKPEDADFFASPEVLLALALLNTIENPRRDIDLTAVLCSPLYRFTADDLALIRHETPEGLPLYEALCLWCETHRDFAKGHFFLAQLNSFRRVAESIPMDKLLKRIFSETPLMAIAGAETESGEANLKLLYNYARTYQGAAFSGLYGFIHFVNKQIESGAKFSPNSISESSNAVTLSTIHKSKGLEFPVVFLVECGAGFSTKDVQASIICDKNAGLSFLLRDPQGLVRSPHPFHNLLQSVVRRQSQEEEMRLLYVALTRAQERLFVTGTVNGNTSLAKAKQRAKDTARVPSVYSICSLHSYLDMILACITASKEEGKWQLLFDPEVETVDGVIAPDLTQLDHALTSQYEENLRHRLAYSYPYAYLSLLPKKLSVSKLHPGILDDTLEETTQYTGPDEGGTKEVGAPAAPEEKRAKKWSRLPQAYTGVNEAAATDKGIATHLFMQFCDFQNLKEKGVASETARLLALGYLDKQQVALMWPKELELFRSSHLFATMCGAKQIWREFRFNINLPAHLFSKNEELLLQLEGESLFVQGVIDALIETDDGDLILVDYKTDRLTREEVANPTLAAQKLRTRHQTQLAYYAEAVKAIFGKTPTHILIYALQLGDTVEV